MGPISVSARRARRWALVALAAPALTLGAACTTPPQPTAPLLVNTTADTFDGTCDTTDCSLRDAIAASNALAPTGGLPNRITVPAGNYALATASPIAVTRPVIISGAGAALTTLDITGSTVAAPGGVIQPQASVVIGSLAIVSTDATPSDVLVSCTGQPVRTATVMNATTAGLAALVAECDTTVVSTAVTGPRTAIAPFALSVSNSTVPMASGTLDPVRMSFVSSVVTGPSAADGTIQNAAVSVQPRLNQLNVPVSFTGSRLVGVDLVLGGVAPGSLDVAVLSTSFGQTGSDGPVQLRVGAGSKARIVNSTVYGGGAGGAIVVDGTLITESVTATTNGPTIVVGATGSVTTRRSILSAATGATCSATINSLGHNLTVGSSCGLAAATDTSVANEAALGLGIVDTWGNGAPSLHRLPQTASPALDAIAPGLPNDLDCPTEAGQGRSIDARGVLRPQGTGCDIGALELQVTPPPPEPAE